MGEVYLAYDTQLERKVALKVLSSELVGDTEGLRRLQREARSLAALDHPNIVPVYSFESAAGMHFLTMAFIDGQSLDKLIPSQGFDLKQLLDLAVPLADALKAAHQHSIVHRDLKPANVMIDRDGRPRVLDFGLAKRHVAASGELAQMTTVDGSEQMTRAGMIVGTFPYMSPEQAEGKPVDARSDIFSFGVMLYEMACGRRPFHGDTVISLISSILRDTHRPIVAIKPGLPARLDAIVARCLEKDPARRYPTAEALRDDLEALRAEAPHVPAPPPAWQAPTAMVIAAPIPAAPARVAGRRALWAAAFVALAAVAGVAAWRLWPRGGAPRPLAVLLFENTRKDAASDYLCEGVAETLIRQMSSLPSLRVSPLSAALALKGHVLSAVEAGKQLGAGIVLAGTLDRQGDHLHITAELFDVQSGARLWSSTYDRPAGDLLGVQAEIAGAILDTGLGAALTKDERLALAHSPTTSGEAYDLYLQARRLTRLSTEDAYLQVIELLQRATVRDPRFARAFLWLGGIHAVMAIDGFERPTDAWALANRFVRQAVALDPNMPDAHAVKHSMAFFFDWDWEGAARERRTAMQFPLGEFDTDLFRTFELELLALGHPEEAVAMARRSRELDPLSTGLAMLEADYLTKAGQLDAAVAVYQRTIKVEPDNPEQYFGLAEALVLQGRFDEAIQARVRAHTVAGDEDIAKRFAAARGEPGYRDADRAWVATQLVWLEGRSAWGYVSPLDLARAHAQLGNRERAFEFLTKAFGDRSPGLVFLNIDRAWDGIRSDPRFKAAVRQVGLPGSLDEKS